MFLFQVNPITRDYNIIIASDPQPWRLDSDGDPNSSDNKEPWERFNRLVVKSMKKLSIEKNIQFIIINGDITEFGRQETLDSFSKVYCATKLNFPYLLGLGNHDYANNVGDCNLDGCAITLVEHMIAEIDDYSKQLPPECNFNFDYNKDKKEGSLAYSWDYGDIHYVQLQNHPMYHVTLSRFSPVTNIKITQSFDWLKKDLEKAKSRNKVTVLNFHDATDHFVSYFDMFWRHANINSYQKQKFSDLFKDNDVIAVFCGHTHKVGAYPPIERKIFGSVPVYNSGALFKGDFLLVEVKGKILDVFIYNGETGTPKFITDTHFYSSSKLKSSSYVLSNDHSFLYESNLKDLNLTVAEKCFSRAKNSKGFESKDYASWKEWYDDSYWFFFPNGIYQYGKRMAEKWIFSLNPYGLVFQDKSFCVGIKSDDTKSSTDNWIHAEGDDWGSDDDYCGQMYFDRNGRPVAIVMTNNFYGGWGKGWSYIYRNGQWDYESDEDWHEKLFTDSTDSLDPNAPRFLI